MSYTEFFEHSLRHTATIAESYFGKVATTVKTDDNNQVLTEADIAIGDYLVGECRRAFPDYNIIDEEAGAIDNGSQYTFVIDPVDGTSNFANGLPHYGTMIGLLDGGTPVAGAIVLPTLQLLYTAEKGQGTYCNGNKVHVSSESTLLNTLVAYGIDGHQENPAITEEETRLLARIVLSIRNLRSSNSAFDLAATADGRYGLSLNRTSKIWDNVAPHIIMEEAGGIYTDFWGAPIDYSNPLTKIDKNFTFCAGAPKLHAAMQAIIQRHSRKTDATM